MAKRKLTNQLISRDQITDRIALINGSDGYYISESGLIYVLYSDNMYFLKKNYQNKYNNYLYCGIKYQGQIKTERVHRLVAQAFLPNHNTKLTIIGHKDNDKTNNHVDNLYWTTTSDNTKKAFDDGLIVNAKGFDDSQSFPVVVYDLNMNPIQVCGSCIEASKYVGVSKSTVCKQCKGQMKTRPRCGYYFRYLSSLTTIERIELGDKFKEASRVVSSFNKNEHER